MQSPAIAGRDRLQAEAGMRADLVVGGKFPDLELPDHRRRAVRLSVLANGYPLILSFYRGYW
jgi:peroxiredoxin